MLDMTRAGKRLTHWQLLCREISALGFEPPRDEPPAVALAVPMAGIVAGNETGAAFFRRLGAFLSANARVCLRVVESGNGDDPIDTFRICCEQIRTFAELRGVDSRRLSVSMPAHLMPAESFNLIADTVLGGGARFLFLDSLQFGEHADEEVQRRALAVWQFLWRHRGAAHPLMPVYGGIVKSGCPLLSAEVATAVLPDGLQVPDHSAWLPIGLSLTRFANADGKLDEALLTRSLERLLPLADELIDDLAPACPRQRRDAHMNRRLAVSISGFGDLVVRRGVAPTELSCLGWLSELTAAIREALQAESARLAALHEPLPALSPADLTVEWRQGKSREAWQSVWRSALSKSAVRHRNLVVISPYAVLPREAPARPGYADLLPLIGHADAWRFGNPHSFDGFRISAFRRFHARARAIIQGSNANAFVAAGV